MDFWTSICNQFSEPSHQMGLEGIPRTEALISTHELILVCLPSSPMDESQKDGHTWRTPETETRPATTEIFLFLQSFLRIEKVPGSKGHSFGSLSHRQRLQEIPTKPH